MQRWFFHLSILFKFKHQTGKMCTWNTVLSTVFRSLTYLLLFIVNVCHYLYCYDYFGFSAQAISIIFLFFLSRNFVSSHHRENYDILIRYLVAFCSMGFGCSWNSFIFFSFFLFLLLSLPKRACACFYSSFFHNLIFSTHVQVLNS